MTVLKCRFYYSGIMSLTDEMIATEEVVYYLSVVPRRRGHTKACHPGPQGKHQGWSGDGGSGGTCRPVPSWWLPRGGMGEAG